MKTTIALLGFSALTGLAGCTGIKSAQKFAELLNVKPYAVTQKPANYTVLSQEPRERRNVVTVHYVSTDVKNDITSYDETYEDTDGDKILQTSERISAALTLSDKKKDGPKGGGHVSFLQERGKDGSWKTFLETQTSALADPKRISIVRMSPEELTVFADFLAPKKQAKSMLNTHLGHR